MVKAWEDMTVEELQTEYERISNETYNHEWQYEFARQEKKELRRLMKEKGFQG